MHAPSKPAQVKESLRPAVETRGITAAYGGVAALSDIDLRLPSAKIIALVGPNGAGKSTLVKLLSGVMHARQGSLQLFGEPPKKIRRQGDVAYVPQEEHIDRDFPISVREVVFCGRFPRMRQSLTRFLPLSFAHPSHHEAVRDALEAVQMQDFTRRPIGALSGGQKKRVFLARALAQEARLLLLDEPLAGVDKNSAALIHDLFHRIRDGGKTVLVVTHDLPGLENLADHVVLLNRKVIAEGPPREVLKPELLAMAFESGLPFSAVTSPVL